MFLVVFAGLDKVGKSSIIKGVSESLDKKGLKVMTLAQPSPQTKDYMRNHPDKKESILLRLAADYVDQLDTIKSIKDDTLVLVDRWFPYCAIAYQVRGLGYSEKYLKTLLNGLIDFQLPDVFFWVDASNEALKTRKHDDLFNSQDVEFLDLVRDGYEEIFYSPITPVKKFRIVTDDSSLNQSVKFVESIIECSIIFKNGLG